MLLQRTISNIGRHVDLSKRPSEHNYIIHRIRVALGLAMAKVSSVEDYEKHQQLRQGSFGTVFKAKHKDSSRIVALKEIKLNSEEESTPNTTLQETLHPLSTYPTTCLIVYSTPPPFHLSYYMFKKRSTCQRRQA